MKYNVFLTDEAIIDLNFLQKSDRKKVLKDFNVIKEVDINAVYIKSITKNINEIKTDNIRTLFTYAKDQIIIVALIFIKKTQKTPLKYIEKAEKIIKEYQYEKADKY